MPGTRDLQRRIKSVKSTRKVTRAMQLVSAAKMRRAQAATLASRTYAGLAWELIQGVSGQTTVQHPLLTRHAEAKKVGVVVISANRGFVGGFNSNLFKAYRDLTSSDTELLYEITVMGRKVRDILRRTNQNIVAEFPKIDTVPDMNTVYSLATLLTEHYKSGAYQKIVIIYNHFVSTLSNTPRVKQLLPFFADKTAAAEPSSKISEYILEPGPGRVMEHLLPRIIESQIYQAILESDASEHSARMVTMKNATDSAADLIDDLTLTFNRLRQDKITTELSEITAGKIALE
jgi:F-type H+-transporting ATPase subunit gamma